MPYVLSLAFALLTALGLLVAPAPAATAPPPSEPERRLQVGPISIGAEVIAGDALATEPLSGEPIDAAALTPGDASRETLLASGKFQLAVPFRSQKDGDRFEGANCGPAALGMVLESFGTVQTNGDLRLRTHTYQGTAGRRGGTALQFMAMVAQDFQLDSVRLYDVAAFHRWTVDQVEEELETGRPVIPLVKYRLLPGHETSPNRWDHYVVIYGFDNGRFLYHDPAYASPEEGAARWITADALDAAMRAAIVPRQAVALGPGDHASLAALPV